VPPTKPYFSFEPNRTGAGVGAMPCRRRGRTKPCCPVRGRSPSSARVEGPAGGDAGASQVRPQRREGVFPFRYVSARGRVNYHNLMGAASSDAPLWVSRGLLAHATRPRWRACADKLLCWGGAQRVATCAFNLGFQLSQAPER